MDDSIIVCIRLDEAESVLEGSTILPCAMCEAELWVSPTGMDFITAQPNIPVLCLDCAAETAPNFGEVTMEAVPGTDSVLTVAEMVQGRIAARARLRAKQQMKAKRKGNQ